MAKTETRNHIIRTAADLFYENGINQTGINEVIKQSGIAKATLYAHFSSKDELIKAYISYKDKELMIAISEFLAPLPSGKKKLLGVLEFVKEFYHGGSFNGCWCVRSMAEIPVSNTAMRKYISDSKRKFLDYLIDLVKDGFPGLSKSKVNTRAEALYLFYESSVSESYLHNEEWPITRNIELLKQYLKNVN